MAILVRLFTCCFVPVFVAPVLTWLWARETPEYVSLESNKFILQVPQLLNSSALLSREPKVLNSRISFPSSLQPRGDRALNHTLLSSLLDAFDATGATFMRSMRRRIERLPHRSAAVEDSAGGISQLHFAHLKQPAVATAKCSASNTCKTVAFMLIHGWPGSFLEFFGSGEGAFAFEPPSDPGPADSTTVADIGGFTEALLQQSSLRRMNVHIIVPSLPGYGFSQPLPSGQSAANIALTLVALMHKLGYGAGGSQGSDGYFTQGGDWGGIIASLMARLDPSSTRGMHNNMAVPGTHMSALAGLALTAFMPAKVLHAEDEQRLRTAGVLPGTPSHLLHLAYSTGYLHEQVTQPDTLATALLGYEGSSSDSVVVNGIAAWMLEKLDGWSDCGWYQAAVEEVQGGYERDALRCLGGIRLMDAIALYASTGTFRSSMWVYADTAVDPLFWGLMGAPLSPSVPVGIADMPGEVLLRFPLPALQRSFPGLCQFSRLPYGGHFAAWETPALLAADVASFAQAVLTHAAEPLVVKGARVAERNTRGGDEEL